MGRTDSGMAAELIRSDAPKRGAEEWRSCVLLHSTRHWRERQRWRKKRLLPPLAMNEK